MAADVHFKIIADIKDAVNKIAFFAENSAAKLRSVEENFEKVTAVAAALPAAFAIEKIISGFGHVISMSADAEKSFVSMQQALRSAGDYSDAAAQSFVELADGIQEVTTYDDNAILGQVALAKSFGASNDEAQRLIKAAVELSAATGISLDAAVKRLGKTLSGTAGELAESAGGIRGLTAEQLRSGAAIDYVEKRFRGSAAALSGTYSGAVDQARNSISNLLESIGDLVTRNNGVVSMVQSVTALVNAVQKSSTMRSLIAVFSGVVAGIGATVAALGAVTIAFAAANAAAAIFGTTLSVALGPIGIAAAAMAALGGAMGLVLSQSSTQKTEMASLTDEYSKLVVKARQYEEMISAANRQGIKSDFAKQQNAALDQTNQRLEEIRNRINALRGPGEKKFKFDPELDSQIKAIEQKIANAGLDKGEILAKEYNKALEALNKGLKTGHLTEVRYAKDTKDLKVQYEQDLSELRLKKQEEEKRKLEQALQAQKQRVSDLFNSPLKILFDKLATIGDVVASSLGAVNLVLSNGTTAARDVKQSYSDTMSSIKEQLAKSNSEIESEYARSRSDIEAQVQAGSITQSAAQEQLAKLQTDFNKRQSEAQIKFQEDSLKAERDYQKSLKDAHKEEIAGAAKVLGNLASTAVEAFFPGFGQIAGPIIEALAKGPDEVRELIDSVIRGLPDVIQNIILAIPEVVDAFADGLPDVIEGIADRMPEIIDRLIERAPDIATSIARSVIISMPIAIAKAAVSFVDKILDGAGQFIQRLIDGIGQAFEKIGQGLGDIGGNLLNIGGRGGKSLIPGINLVPDNVPVIGGLFAKGGEIPPGYPNDTYIAGLSSGENVIDRSLSQRLTAFLERNSSGDSVEPVAIFGGSRNERVLQPIIIKIDRKELASALIDIHRYGLRTV